MLKFRETMETIPSECKGGKSDTLGCPVIFGRECGRVTLVDMDCVAASSTCRVLGVNDTRCDYLVFGRDTGKNQDLIAVIEAKSRKPNASKVIRQIRAGIRHVTQLVCHVDDFTFFPAIVCKGSMSKADRRRLEGLKVRLFGEEEEIRVVLREKMRLPPRENGA